MSEPLPRTKVWRHPRVLREHAFDKLRLLDCTLGEFEIALEHAEVIEEVVREPGASKQRLLLLEWRRPLHAVVVVDDLRQEGRLVTVYEPDPALWSSDYRRRR